MPDVLLYGATGYTGRLTAHALARRNANFVVAGRNREKLQRVAADTAAVDARVIPSGQVGALVDALEDVKVICTCVGPFGQFGWDAVEAALTAGVNYLDSTGEAPFIAKLIETKSESARERGIAMAPSMGFDEVINDVVATLAAHDMESPELVLTLAFPGHGSSGTIRTMVTNILEAKVPWIHEGRQRLVGLGQHTRWAPMPSPLGPKLAVSAPLAIAQLAPLHLDLRLLETYLTVGTLQRVALRFGGPLLRTTMRLPGAYQVLERALPTGKGPSEETRNKDWFTALAEARSGDKWRNVTLTGRDAYGLTAELLATGAMKMGEKGYDVTGVVAPVQAVGLETLHKELIDFGVSTETYE